MAVAVSPPAVSNEDLIAVMQLRDNGTTYEEARDQLVKQNEGLVWHVVHHRARCGSLGSLTDEDLFQEGIMGMLVAAEKFNLDLGWRFSTYCYYWIRQYITRALQNSSLVVRVPVQHWWTKSERKAFPQPVSLDLKVGAEQDTTLSDFLPDPSDDPATQVCDSVEDEEQRATILGMLGRCSPLQQYVLVRRYGLFDPPGDQSKHRVKGFRSLSTLSEDLNVSMARVRAIENRAFRHIRDHLARKRRERNEQ